MNAQIRGAAGLQSIDRLRRRRNQPEYPDPSSYDPVTSQESENALHIASECIEAAARLWGTAAGRLAQHQAAFDITDGLGPRQRFLDSSAYTESRADIEEGIARLRQPTPTRRLEIDVPGLEM